MFTVHVQNVLCQLQCRLTALKSFPDYIVGHSLIKTVPLLLNALMQLFHILDLVFANAVLQNPPHIHSLGTGLLRLPAPKVKLKESSHCIINGFRSGLLGSHSDSRLKSIHALVQHPCLVIN